MPTIDSLKNGIHLLELIADEGAPLPTPELIEKCKAFDMSAATVRNVIETLAGRGWLQKSQGPGNAALYGLGSKAAGLWKVYVSHQIEDLTEKNEDQAREIQRLRRMVELGTE